MANSSIPNSTSHPVSSDPAKSVPEKNKPLSPIPPSYPAVEAIRPFAYREPASAVPKATPTHPLRRGSDKPTQDAFQNDKPGRGN